MKDFFYECFYDETNVKLHITDGLITFFVIVSLSTIPLEFIVAKGPIAVFLDWLVKIVVTFFTIEYFLRIWVAPQMLRYIFSFRGGIDVLAIAPYYMYKVGFITSMPLWLGLRLLRSLKLVYVDEIHHSHLPGIEARHHYGAITFHPEEKLIYIARRSSYCFLFEAMVAVFVLSVCLVFLSLFDFGNYVLYLASAGLLLSALIFVRAWLNNHYDAIFLTNQRLIIQDRDLFGTRINEIHYEAITNIVPDSRGIWNCILRMGTICVETGSVEDRIEFKYLRWPHRVVDILNKQRFSKI